MKSILSRYMAKNRFTSALYYFIFDFQYHREQQATLAGKNTYQANEGVFEKSSALLRRNTHRLEKGLIMVPRKPIFAESYIIETVNCLSQCLHLNTIEPAELKWAQDVLEKYFKSVDHCSVIKQANELFEKLPLVDSQSSIQSIPYLYSERIISNIDSKALHQLFKQRRSTRWFDNKPVDIQVIKQAVEMASQAPSACNRQPFQFYTITDAKKASKIAAIPMGTKGFAENIQALLVIVGDLSAYPKERDRHVIYIDGGLVAMQLMLAFESLGLSTCPINWPDIELYEKQMDKALSLEKHQRPIMLMAVGYGEKDGGIPFSQKKSAEQLIKEIS
ncbi:nitroreductase family protein [Colwellia sp. 1_MG-2023]|uniref:nitroreductase family protein n=1 Tax=Colwellia sp. 1_MG-2023 TaxID=3062649 RepID=UPI0026E1EF71|nr:nitroreductase family protein [Colwellia sp. 1_MG-2023]MDO6444324.1 nitroreductase family protein [Colwellia sp. 1_MG-2023]